MTWGHAGYYQQNGVLMGTKKVGVLSSQPKKVKKIISYILTMILVFCILK